MDKKDDRRKKINRSIISSSVKEVNSFVMLNEVHVPTLYSRLYAYVYIVITCTIKPV